MNNIPITREEFNSFSKLVHTISGIYLKPEKIFLVENRLNKRLRHYGYKSFTSYLRKVNTDAKELEEMLNLITTNETSFFREPMHYDFLRNELLPNFRGSEYRVWSAACSIGAEIYSAAMVIDDFRTSQGRGFSVSMLASDINTEVTKKAADGLYPIKFSEQIEKRFLKKYCLLGEGQYNGQFLIDDYLKKYVKYTNLNLMETPPEIIGKFDLIFLRNMLIYFDNKNKKHIVENVAKRLKVGGYLFIGHSESLHGITNILRQVKPTIYIKDK